MPTEKRIAVLTSGGDCPGLNAVIYGVVRSAAQLNKKIIGFNDGYEGIIAPGGDYVELDHVSTSGIVHLGGTILGTTNRGNFNARRKGKGSLHIPNEILQKARQTFDELSLEGLVVIGGDGSLSTALYLHQKGFPVVGVPKTIDNDLDATAVTFGFDSAVACVTDSLDRLHTTAESHKRIMVLEVMGRDSGWIALYGGLAGGADIILIPEIPFDYERIARVIRQREEAGNKSTMIVVAEGAAPRTGKKHHYNVSHGEYRLGGIGNRVATEIHKLTKKDVRSCTLGHLQRGGPPTMFDRNLGIRFGVRAAQLIKEKKFGSMVSYQNDQITSVPLADAVHRTRRIKSDDQVLEAARAVGIVFAGTRR
ncbi:MAG: 6-phosphofructokinase [Chthoniobacterales bacterium]